MQVATDVTSELVALERQYWNAIREKDASAAHSLSADPCLLVGAQGVSEIDRKTLAKMLENGPFELSRFDLDDVHVRAVTDDVVIVAYKVEEDLVVEGKAQTLQAFDSSVWVRRDGRWTCVLHTESIAGDPFGRK